MPAGVGTFPEARTVRKLVVVDASTSMPSCGGSGIEAPGARVLSAWVDAALVTHKRRRETASLRQLDERIAAEWVRVDGEDLEEDGAGWVVVSM